MTTKALFVTALGGLVPVTSQEFVRSSGDILTAAAHGLQTGAGPFKCMTTSAGDLPSGLVAAVRSSTFVTAVSAIATDVIIVGGKSYTFIATPADDGDIDVGASDAASMENLARAINLGPGAGTDYDIDTVGLPTISAEARGDTVVFTAVSLDSVVGDALAVSSVDSTLTVDNATLQNGVTGTDYFVIRLTDGTYSLALTLADAVAGTAVTLADAGTGVHTLVRTVQTLADSQERVLLEQLTATGRRVNVASRNIAAFWQNSIDGLAD